MTFPTKLVKVLGIAWLTTYTMGCIPLIGLAVASQDIQRQNAEQIREANLHDKEIEYTHEEHMLIITGKDPNCAKKCYYNGTVCYYQTPGPLVRPVCDSKPMDLGY